MTDRLLATTIAAVMVCIATSALADDSATVEHLNSGKIFPADFPFSEAVRVGNLLFLSGQVGVDPATMKIVAGGIAQETLQTMANIKATLETHGYAMSDLVKCTVMLADISEWESFNDIYKSFFADDYPARSALGASGLALGARVEVDCIAARGD